MSVTYLTTPIVEVLNDPPPRGSGMTREGYTKRSGAPTARMIRLEGEKRWRRLMVWQFSNTGTMFVNIDGKPHVVREEDLPAEGAPSTSAHATRKSARGKTILLGKTPYRVLRRSKLAITLQPLNSEYPHTLLLRDPPYATKDLPVRERWGHSHRGSNEITWYRQISDDVFEKITYDTSAK